MLASPPFFKDLIIHSVNNASIPRPPVVYALVSEFSSLIVLLASVITAL